MKKQLVAAFALLTFFALPRVHAQVPTVDYSVIKVSASLPAVFQAADNVTLLNFTFTTKALINIALNKDINTPVPKNIILGYAGDFDAFGHNTPNTSSPAQLVVFDTDMGAKLKTIGIASNRTVVESRFAAPKFKRVALGTLTIQDTSAGAAFGAFTGGTLQIGGTVTRTPKNFNSPPDLPSALKVNVVTNVVGTIVGFYTKAGGPPQNGTFIVSRGTLKASGKIVGTFTE